VINRFIEFEGRQRARLLFEHSNDYMAEENPVRLDDVSIDDLHLQALEALQDSSELDDIVSMYDAFVQYLGAR
jgi:hypothetical protein